MTNVFQAALVGLIVAVVLTAWIGIGYFVQAKLLRNPKPGESAILTAMVVTMIVFSVVAIWSGHW